jgi:hypothetical protein
VASDRAYRSLVPDREVMFPTMIFHGGMRHCIPCRWLQVSFAWDLLPFVRGKFFYLKFSFLFGAYTLRTLLRMMRSSGLAAYSLVLTMIIESGFIYSAVLLIGLALYMTGSNTFYIVYEQFGQLMVRFFLFTVSYS